MRAPAPGFYDDDPLMRVADTQDASKAAAARDFAHLRLGDQPVRTSRALRRRPRREASTRLTRCPTRAGSPTAPARSRRTRCWRGSRATTRARRPATGRSAASRTACRPGSPSPTRAARRYFVKFDPPGLPELGTGAEAVVTRLFHALGYNVPQADRRHAPPRESGDRPGCHRPRTGRRPPSHAPGATSTSS